MFISQLFNNQIRRISVRSISSVSIRSRFCQNDHIRSNRISSHILLSRRCFGKHQDFILPDIGEGIVEVEVLEWFVKPGDQIKQFDKVCSVQSDKATTDITSRFDGIVKTLSGEVGDIAFVGKPLITLEVAGDDSSETGSDSKTTSKSPSSTETAKGTPELHKTQNIKKVKTTPAVRALAKEHNIDLSKINPTGPGDRVTKQDVLAYLESDSATPTTKIPVGREASKETDEGWKIPTSAPIIETSSVSIPDKTVKIQGIRRAMVKTMSESAQIPTFLYSDEICVDALTEIRNDLKPIMLKRGLRLTLMPFFIKATSIALLQHPILNSLTATNMSEYTQMSGHNISIAIDTPTGLIVPSIKRVQNLSIAEIAGELMRLQSLGSEGKLGQDDLSFGTFSLSNIGSIGGTVLRPLILPPQVAIGALGRIQTLPRYNKQMEVKPSRILHASWSGDHRIIDGATMARFANLWKDLIENPHRIFLDTK